jgi:hypothetical protein
MRGQNCSLHGRVAADPKGCESISTFSRHYFFAQPMADHLQRLRVIYKSVTIRHRGCDPKEEGAANEEQLQARLAVLV